MPLSHASAGVTRIIFGPFNIFVMQMRRHATWHRQTIIVSILSHEEQEIIFAQCGSQPAHLSSTPAIYKKSITHDTIIQAGKTVKIEHSLPPRARTYLSRSRRISEELTYIQQISPSTRTPMRVAENQLKLA
jgi:hypothetical protein